MWLLTRRLAVALEVHGMFARDGKLRVAWLQRLDGLFAKALEIDWTAEHIWLVSFMEYELGYFDDETCRLEPIEDPFGPRLLPMSPE